MKKKTNFGVLVKKISTTQSKDTGLAVVLILLLLFLFLENKTYIKTAVIVQIINMICPSVFKPLAVLWFGLAELMGTIMSKIILTMVYALIVVPVGAIRKMIGKDTLLLKQWKKNGSSVFWERNHLFTTKDVEHPY